MKTRAIQRIVLMGSICILTGISAGAQVYENAAGIRAGYSSGISYKRFFLHAANAIGADVFYNNHGLHLSGQFLTHLEADRKSRWLVYGGGGPFGGQWDEELSLGICGVIGVEYLIRDLPLNVGVDWRPLLNLYRHFDYDLLDFGITIRYRFSF